MAIPFIKLPPPPLHHPSPSPSPSLLSFPPKPSLILKPHHLHLSAAAATKDKDDSSLTSLLSDLEPDPIIDANGFTTRSPSPSHHLHHLPSRWPELHGDQHWSGLLDPIDPLLRSELIRYGEFAQSCYDAFDFDPFSRYCGSSKYPRRKFFSSLAMDSCGYDVSRFLYATSNINLPNFFSRSRWDRTWSHRANWIGYIAVSSDATTALLGRRDIVIAWRGTVTKLEWIADLMDFLRPISSENIPSPVPTVKVESGFLDLYTDKDNSCRFCKYSGLGCYSFSWLRDFW